MSSSRTPTSRRFAIVAGSLLALLWPLAAVAPADAASVTATVDASAAVHEVSLADTFDVPVGATTVQVSEGTRTQDDTFESFTASVARPTDAVVIPASVSRSNGILTIDIPAVIWQDTSVGESFDIFLDGWSEPEFSDVLHYGATATVVASGNAPVTRTLDIPASTEDWRLRTSVTNVQRGDTVFVEGTPGLFTGGLSGEATLTTVEGSFTTQPPSDSVTVSDDGGTATFEAPAPSRSAAAVDASVNPTFQLTFTSADLNTSLRVFVEMKYADTDPAVDRVAGSDRYEAASAISAAAYPDGASVVFLTSGTKFPDALSAAPVAASIGGPLLITLPDRLPDSIADEIVRLQPETVFIVGGPNSVSAAVEEEVTELVGEPIRVDGADRYEVSRNLVELAWSDAGVDSAYIATGADFPDALSASAAAGSRGIPVILVNGKADALDDATLDLLTSLGVSEPIIAGGPASVSIEVEDSLRSLPGASDVERLWGDNRYTASLAIARSAFDTANQVFFATGRTFPDALAGAAWAGAVGGPLYVLPGDCVLDGVVKDIDRYRLADITLLGGTDSLSSAVQSLAPCGWGDIAEGE